MLIDKIIWTHGANVQQLLQFMAALSPSPLPLPKFTENETVKGLLLQSLAAESLLLKLGSAWSTLQLMAVCSWKGRELFIPWIKSDVHWELQRSNERG